MSARIFISRDLGALCVGAEQLATAFRKTFEKRGLEVEIVRTGSRGMYWLEPLVEVERPEGRVGYGPVHVGDIDGLLDGGMLDGKAHKLGIGVVADYPWLKKQTRLTFKHCGIVDPRSLQDYKAHDGYKGLAKALEVGPKATVEEVVASGLRGRGGAGFPTGIKWHTVADTPPQQKYIVCNADEGDSGTFADRMIMEGDPFVLIEGMTIAGIAVGATKGYIYIRSEYPDAIEAMEIAVREARNGGMLGRCFAGSEYGFDIEVRAGAGAYVCGEETSLLESLEGKRGEVRAKPPLPAHIGLFGKPTVINNVLSLASVPIIMSEGGPHYRDYGMGKSRGTMPIQLAGNIKHGGLFETAFGITLGELRRRYRRRHALGPSGTRGPGRWPAWGLFPARAFRYAVRLRGVRRPRRAYRPWRDRRVRRQRGHGQAGPLRHGVLRHRILRQMHAVPHRLGPRRRAR